MNKIVVFIIVGSLYFSCSACTNKQAEKGIIEVNSYQEISCVNVIKQVDSIKVISYESTEKRMDSILSNPYNFDLFKSFNSDRERYEFYELEAPDCIYEYLASYIEKDGSNKLKEKGVDLMLLLSIDIEDWIITSLSITCIRFNINGKLMYSEDIEGMERLLLNALKGLNISEICFEVFNEKSGRYNFRVEKSRLYPI